MKRKQLPLLALLLTASLFHTTSFAQAPTAGLVGYWPMNGNYNAGPGTSINGVNAGSTATTDKAGVANSAMNFSNPASMVSQYAAHPVTAGLNFTAAQDFSISFMFYLPSWFHNIGFYDNNLNYNGIGIWMWDIGSKVIQFNFRNGSLASTALQLGTWYHVCCVKNGSVLRIYLNGALNTTGAPGTQTPTYTYAGKFGTMSFNGQTPAEYNGYNGKLDEFRIYNRALTATEIYQMASVALPLKLGDFTVSKKSNGTQLNWETISEQNSSHFEIEKSTDGNQYTKLGQVSAKGNSTDRQVYSWLDPVPATGTVFYRLKLVDLDGTAMYSRVVVLKNMNELVVSTFPNPVHDLLNVQLTLRKKENIHLQLTDLSGKTVYNNTIVMQDRQNATSIPVSHLPAGTYFLVLNREEGQQVKTIIKK
jgi:hypothetical protein